ncbi:MAG: cysteine desulfurase family protein [Rhodoglobus sp.]
MAVYLDYASTAPMPPAVLDVYTEALRVVGNPSSLHSQGQNARRMLEEARESVAVSVGADYAEVTFTSGGTEAINLAIKGLFWDRQDGSSAAKLAGALVPRPRILATRAEHHATLDALEWLEQHEGAVIDWVPVSATGRIDLDYLAAALADDVALVTTLWANNEVGTVQPVVEVAALAVHHGIPVHADAVSAYGYLPLNFRHSGLAAMSVSAHKIGGPAGIGALVLARSATLTPLIHGGSQQRVRSGTLDAAGAVAFGAAAVLATQGIVHAPLRSLRDRLIAGVRAAVPAAILRGDPHDRLPGNAHFTFPGCEGDSLLFMLDAAGFGVSTGSACQAGVAGASHVLLALGLDEPTARGALRISLGHETTSAEVEAFLAALPAAVAQARAAGLADRTPNLGR